MNYLLKRKPGATLLTVIPFKAKRKYHSKIRKLFRDDIIEESEELAGLGLTLEQIARVFGVSPSTIYNWKNKNPEMQEALSRGVARANKLVSNSMFQNALGGFKTAERTRYRQGKLVEKSEVFAPPNVAAGKFWLTNRAKDEWKEKSPEEKGDLHLHFTNIVNKLHVLANGNGQLKKEDNGRSETINVRGGVEIIE